MRLPCVTCGSAGARSGSRQTAPPGAVPEQPQGRSSARRQDAGGPHRWRCGANQGQTGLQGIENTGELFVIVFAAGDQSDQPLTVALGALPLLFVGEVLLCSRCKLSVRNSIGRRAEGGTVGARMDNVLRTVSVVSPTVGWAC